MESDIYLNYYVDLGKKIGYDVRFADSWNAYDWLKN